MKENRNGLKKNYAYNLLYRIVTLVTPLITSPYISRVIGADGIGQYSYTYAISHYFLIFAVLGVSDYGNRCIAKVRDSKEERNKVFSEIVSLQILLSVGMSILYIIYCLVVTENRRLAYMQGFNVLSAIFDVTWLLFGLELFYVTTLRNVIVKIGTVLLILLLVKSPNDVWKYTLIMSGGTLVGQLSVWPILRNYVCFIRPKWNDVIKHLKPNLVLFLPVIANDLLGYFDKIMIGNMSIDAELGCYDNAEKLLSIPNSLVTALGTVMLPRVSNSIAKGELKSVNEMIQKSMLFVVFATSALVFGICAVAKEFVPLFFGTGFDLVVPLLYTLAPYIIFVSKPEKHYIDTKKALLAGKHVLCESPIALKETDCEELYSIAEEHGLVLMDAIKTAYSTAYERLVLLAKTGKIGKVVSVDAVCTSLRDGISIAGTDLTQKWNSMCGWAPAALLPVFQILGTEYRKKVITTKFLDEAANMDAFTKIDFTYGDAVASIKVAKAAKSEGELIVTGTKGYIYVPAPWWKTDYFEVRYENAEDNQRFFYQLDGEGIRYEIVAFAKSVEVKKPMNYVEKGVSKSIAKIIESFNDRTDMIVI